MKQNFHLTVKDILSRKNFEHARIIAGNKGVDRPVKWVHVVEVTTIKNLLNGNELILSTGVAWKEEETFLSLFKQLIDCGASGLCIEIRTNITTIPDSIIDLAEKHSFPIIVFEQEVPFVCITQDIHASLINQQYEMISNLERYGQSLNKKLLHIENYKDILRYLHEELNVTVLFQLKDHSLEIVPGVTGKNKKLLSELKEEKSKQIASSKVVLFGQEYAEVFMYHPDYSFGEYELLLLDRTSTALAQYLLRELYVSEKKRAEDSKWLSSWLQGKQTAETISTYLSEINSASSINGGLVCICSHEILTESENLDLTYFILVSRNIFEQQGFVVLTENQKDRLTYILLNIRRTSDWKERLTAAFERIKESELLKSKSSPAIFFSAGTFQTDLMKIHQSYETAEQTFSLYKKLSKEETYYFYEDLHLYRFISLLDSQVDMQETAESFFSSLIQYDQQTNGHLFKTLEVYLNCHGSKKETAKKLFIVRQTLYHRLKKIEELLGEDFMSPEKRVTIEFLLFAYKYLQNPNDVKKYQTRKA
jgi:PucR family transcriptional regulator, purine catabolism regulatory protein